ncbi:MAG: cystathionine gamma-synthase [Deltaproteobacteria bacterium CG11_big_fil_rev_8_21_14_0_20_49_13]|nr:MAG: cystathionine gamma-synthase [Deltaproteobacteria bacterium CG11_big_fil_rev_8_21_14_0_20_49_13]
MKIGTKTVHKGQRPDKDTGAVIPSICQTTTFMQKSPGRPIGEFEYTRAGNPNFSRLEETLASIENGRYATVLSSGLGALTAWLFSAGRCHIVANEDLYGGTYRLLINVFAKYGVKSSFARSDDPGMWKKAVRPETKWLLIETPTNPLLKIVDLKQACSFARSKNIKVIVDNTFASPVFQNPLDLGADVVIHSSTKYLGGHSDVIGGALITNDKELKKRFDFYRKAAGLNPSPFDCWLISRGIKTLALRMAAHEKNAAAIAKYLRNRREIKEVYYPGLASHPQQRLAHRQMKGFGGMVTVEFGNEKSAKRFIKRLKLFCLAESLGGVESLVCQPSSMTHASIPSEERKKIGIKDNMVRLSVGIEDTDDLLEDIEAALKR